MAFQLATFPTLTAKIAPPVPGKTSVGTAGFGTYIMIDRNGLASDGPVYGADIAVVDLAGVARYQLGYANFDTNFIV